MGSPRARQVSSALAEFMESHTPRPRSAADTVDAGSMTRLTDEPTAELGRRLTKLMEALAEEAEVAQQRHAKVKYIMFRDISDTVMKNQAKGEQFFQNFQKLSTKLRFFQYFVIP